MVKKVMLDIFKNVMLVVKKNKARYFQKSNVWFLKSNARYFQINARCFQIKSNARYF